MARLGAALRSDWTGLALVVAGAGWTIVAAALADGDTDPWHTIALYVAVASAYAGARLASRRGSAIVPVAIVAVGALVVVISGPGSIYTASPRTGPFGFSSITGAFFLQCAFGAGLLLFDRRLPMKGIGALAAVAFLAVPFATQTRTAMALLVLIPLVFGMRALAGTTFAIRSAAVLSMLAIVVSVVIAAGYSGADAYDKRAERSSFDRIIDATISLRRVEFQHDALDLLLEHPAVGVGPGRFDDVSAAVARDADEPWAHNDFLQQGAEAGLPGLAVLVALVAWAFVRLLSGITRRRRSIVVAIALAALCIHACVEYVLQRPAVPAIAAALLGSAVLLRPAGAPRPTVSDAT